MLKLTEAAKYFICNAIFGKPVTVIHYSFNNSTLSYSPFHYANQLHPKS